jgi:CheR methyltransferase, SAM binding domain
MLERRMRLGRGALHARNGVRWRPALRFTVIATDADETMIERAKATCYARSSLKDLPPEWLDRAFIRRGQLFCLAPEFRKGVELGGLGRRSCLARLLQCLRPVLGIVIARPSQTRASNSSRSSMFSPSIASRSSWVVGLSGVSKRISRSSSSAALEPSSASLGTSASNSRAFSIM